MIIFEVAQSLMNHLVLQNEPNLASVRDPKPRQAQKKRRTSGSLRKELERLSDDTRAPVQNLLRIFVWLQ